MLPEQTKNPPLTAAPTDSPVGLWTLWRKCGNEAVTHLVFSFKGDLKEAAIRAAAHCKKMRHKFIKVEPFCVDLDTVEKSAEREELKRIYGESGIPDKPKKGFVDELDTVSEGVTK